MIKIDWDSIIKALDEFKPKKVLIVGPDGLVEQLQEIYDFLEKRGIKPVISGDPSYGSCDLHLNKAFTVGADLIINLGHSIGLDRIGRVVFVNAEYIFDETEIKELAEKILSFVEQNNLSKKAGFYTISNYYTLYKKLVETLNHRLEIPKPNKFETLLENQVLGCNFYSSFNAPADYNFFIGESRFHAIGIQLSTEKDTYMVDPHTKEIIPVKEEALKYLKSSFARIYLASRASTIGLIIGEKEGQVNLRKADFLEKELSSFGYKIYKIMMNEITTDKVNKFTNIDAFVETACPRIPMNVEGFSKPVLSYLEAMALIKLKKKIPVENPFRAAVWY